METAPGAVSLGSWRWQSIVTTMFPLLIVLSCVVLIAGVTLEQAEELLTEYGVLAVMVPTMIDTGGNLGAILASRLSSRLHLGTTQLSVRDRMLWANVGAVLALGVSVFAGLGVGAWAVGRLVGSELGLLTLLTISLGSGLSVAVLAVVCSIVTTALSYRWGIDPDDTTIPIVTNVVDVFGMLVFLGLAGWIVG